MGNMCCRRVGYSPNGAELDHNRCNQQLQQQQQQQIKTQAMSNAYHNAGDDCAINELLEGRMDLDVIMPDGRQVRLTVDRRTPMMDLLVQAASATKISPGGHVIHVFGDGGKGSNTLHYKPSTPIGSLDTNTICIVPKKDIHEPTLKRFQRIANRPFEPTFRVQVHLPRNQLTVVRVSPRVKISELRNMVCQEKGLETSRYQLVRPSDPAQALSGDMTLSEYGSTEITLLSNSSIESNICNSNSHIMPYAKRVDDQKKKTGILRLLAEDVNKKLHKNNGNHIHLQATKVGDSHAYQSRYKPKKRRPAPPPPPPVLPEVPFHSRQSSSDSSGYHEATSSFLHEEHCTSTDEKASSDSSGVSSLDAKVTAVEPPPIQNVKKRRAPPPPPKTTILVEDNPVVKNVETEPLQSEEFRPPDQVLPDVVQSSQFNIETCPPENNVPQDDMKIKEIKEELISKEPNPAEIRLESDTVRKIELKESKTEKRIKAEKKVETNNMKIKEIKEELISKEPTPVEIHLESDTVRKIESKESKTEKRIKAEKKVETNEPVTRVALVALNARIEQDVTQQEIASSIQAAFHSLESPQRLTPSLLAIKQRIRPSEEDKIQVTQNNSCNEISDENALPQNQYSDLNIDDTISDPYPLQKSSATLTLNLETKENGDIGIETFLPPPTEFRSDVEKEVLLTDDESTHSTTSIRSEGSKTLKRSSSLLSVTNDSSKYPASKSKNRNLQRSLSDVSSDDVDDNGEFEIEQERLQLEYIKLQRQFIQWQQQLLTNHAMLREECILPQYARTLRQSHSLPEGEDYSDEAPSPIPLVSRSLSYEPTQSRCSTLPRSTINIPSLELNSKPINNGSSTLRSSKNKNYFKPPQVRVSTKSRQRLPPEIRKDGELDITDDSKILSTILPTFDSLKFISEHKDEEIMSKKSQLQNGSPTIKLENSYNRKIQQDIKVIGQSQNPNKLATFPKPNLKINNDKHIQNGYSETNLNRINGESGQLNRLPTTLKSTKQSVCTQPPPPPPLPIQNEKSKGIITEKSNKFSGEKNKLIKKELQPQSDPREQLMQEIRRFGGRTTLRKISLM